MGARRHKKDKMGLAAFQTRYFYSTLIFAVMASGFFLTSCSTKSPESDEWVCSKILVCEDGTTSHVSESTELDDENKPVCTSVYADDGSLNHTIVYSYDADDRLTSELVHWPSGSTGSETTYHYDKSGALLEKVVDNTGRRTRSEYDSTGIIRAVTERAIDDNGEEGYLFYESEYNSNGKETRYVRYDDRYEGNLPEERFAEYDQDNRLVSFDFKDIAEDETHHLTFQYSEDGRSRTTYMDGSMYSEDELDEHGNTLSGFLPLPSGWISGGTNWIHGEFEYDELGNMTFYKATYPGSDEAYAEFRFAYNEGGLLLSEYTTDPDSQSTYARTFEYTNKRTDEQISGGDPAALCRNYSDSPVA